MIDKKFSKSFDEVLQQAYLFYDGFLIDEADFTAASPLFAIPFAANFLIDIEAADALPTNEDDLNEQTLLTQAVEEDMESAREHYQKLLLYINLAWPDDKAIAKAFGSTLYDKARSNTLKLINLMQDSFNDANSVTYKADLIAVGFVQADIDLLGSLADDITAKNRVQEKFMKLSSQRSETRIVAFNKVWDSMAKLSDTSKIIFKDSPAKIEYYLLYPTGEPQMPGKVQNMGYDLPTNTVSWDADFYSDTYQLERKFHTDPDWTVVYEGADTSVVDVLTTGTWLYRCRGQNENGYGDWSDELLALIPV